MKAKHRNKEAFAAFEKIQKKLAPFFKKTEKNPHLLVCKAHKATRDEVRKFREEHSWRSVASLTSKGKCSNQICGWFLCIDAGVDKGPWDM